MRTRPLDDEMKRGGGLLLGLRFQRRRKLQNCEARNTKEKRRDSIKTVEAGAWAVEDPQAKAVLNVVPIQWGG